MLGSCKLFLHIAHVSVHIDHDHTATAFHLKILSQLGKRKKRCVFLSVTFFTSNVVGLASVRDMKASKRRIALRSSSRVCDFSM